MNTCISLWWIVAGSARRYVPCSSIDPAPLPCCSPTHPHGHPPATHPPTHPHTRPPTHPHTHPPLLQCLGTFITEFKLGAAQCSRLFNSHASALEAAEKLVAIAVHYGFDVSSLPLCTSSAAPPPNFGDGMNDEGKQEGRWMYPLIGPRWAMLHPLGDATPSGRQPLLRPLLLPCCATNVQAQVAGLPPQEAPSLAPRLHRLSHPECHIHPQGWLINIENPLTKPQIHNLQHFLGHLRARLRVAVPGGEVIWYDAVTSKGKLEWQNALTRLNEPFFDLCDGIFTNYCWRVDTPAQSAALAGGRWVHVF